MSVAERQKLYTTLLNMQPMAPMKTSLSVIEGQQQREVAEFSGSPTVNNKQQGASTLMDVSSPGPPDPGKENMMLLAEECGKAQRPAREPLAGGKMLDLIDEY